MGSHKCHAVAREFVNEDVDYSKFKALSGRILYGHAEDDPTCPYKGGQVIMQNLKDNGVEFETRIYPSGTFFYPSAHFSWVLSMGMGYCLRLILCCDETARQWLFSKTK